MKNSTIVWIVIVLIILGVGTVLLSHKNNEYAITSTTDLNPSTSSGQAGSEQTGTSQATTSQTVVLNTSTNATIGAYLVGKDSMTLYTYSKDSSGVSNCIGTCAQDWPPYTVSTVVGLLAEPGVNGAIGTLVRADGTTQLTYNGYPLYYWQGDAKAGDTTGDNVNGFAIVKP